MEPKKLQPKLLACHATQIWTKIQPGYRLAPFTFFINLYLTPQHWEQKPGLNSKQVWSGRFFGLIPLCPLCECLPLAGIPSTPAPNSTLQHCYIKFIMLISWSRGRSGQVQKCIFSLPKWVKICSKPHRTPQNAKFPANVNDLDVA